MYKRYVCFRSVVYFFVLSSGAGIVGQSEVCIYSFLFPEKNEETTLVDKTPSFN